MSVKKKKFLVTTQKHEMVAVHQKPSAFFNHCEKCNQTVEMLTLDTATFYTGKSTRELFRLIENDCLHSIETERGHLLVCQQSLKNFDGKKLLNK